MAKLYLHDIQNFQNNQTNIKNKTLDISHLPTFTSLHDKMTINSFKNWQQKPTSKIHQIISNKIKSIPKTFTKKKPTSSVSII